MSRINFKPAVEFDKKYNTNLSVNWDKYPNDMSSDEVFQMYITDGYYNSTEYIEYAKLLTIEHFPYDDIESLNTNQKHDIIAGMISGFNYDDIVHFSINKVVACNNRNISNELINLYGNILERDVQWVMSPQTLERLKYQLKFD